MRVEKPDKGVAEAYDAASATWDNKIQDPRSYHFWSYGAFDRVVQPYADGSKAILDIGCGTGAWLAGQGKKKAGRLLVGIDVSPKMARRAVASGCPTLIADAQRQPFKDRAFDLVVSRGDAIAQAYDPVEAFREVRRVLASGGHVCFEMHFVLPSESLFEGLEHHNGKVVYRRDSIIDEGVKIQVIKRYHLPPGEVQRRAEKEIGDEPFCRCKWPSQLVPERASVHETHLLRGTEDNVRALLERSGLTVVNVLGTGLLGHLVSTGRLSSELIERLIGNTDLTLAIATAFSPYTNLADCGRATVIGAKK